MATNPPIANSKATPASTPLLSAQSQAGSSASGDNYGQRRAGSSGSHGAGKITRASPSPRNVQQTRKQNKGSKKYQRYADEDAMAESAAVRSSSSRKGQTSITHLMTFSLPPRHHHSSYGHLRNYRRNPTFGVGSGHHAIDKARYVHANYRFIVDPRGNYHAQSVDADVYLDWSNVMQILVSSKSQTGSCPICLSDPVAPRMAKCGHIFCLACLIRYMQAEDESQPRYEKRARWKKCPICEDSIYISETRPVRWFVGQEQDPPREGGDVVLRLVSRLNGSTLALPRDGAESLPKGEDTPWYHAAEVMDYARIMRGSENYMLEQFDHDIQAVEEQEKKDEVMFGDDTAVAVQKAVRLLTEAKEKVKGIGNPPTAPSKPAELKPKRSPIHLSQSSDMPDMYNVQHAARSGQSVSKVGGELSAAAASEPSNDVPSPDQPSEARRPSANTVGPSVANFRQRQVHSGHQPPSEYYFYQALLHYYLSPLDIRILREAFGNFSSFPSTILPRVERVNTGHVVDDDLRKRHKYLAHLPYGCEVSFLECDWTDTVAPEVLERFKPEIERRRKRNQDKEYREEKARELAEREEEKRYAFARRKRPSSPVEERFTADDFQPLAQRNGAELSSSFEHASSSPPWNTRRGQGSGYASLASPGTSPQASRTVWGTPAVAPASPPLQPVHPPEDADDGWLQGWEKDLLQEEDLVAEAQALSLGESSKAAGSGNGGGGGGGGKKKKAKKITLMSTNVRRGA